MAGSALQALEQMKKDPGTKKGTGLRLPTWPSFFGPLSLQKGSYYSLMSVERSPIPEETLECLYGGSSSSVLRLWYRAIGFYNVADDADGNG